MSNQELKIQTSLMAAPTTVQDSSDNKTNSSKIGAALLALREIASDDAKFMATSRELAADARRSSLEMRLNAALGNFISRMAEAIGSIVSGSVQIGGSLGAMSSMRNAANPPINTPPEIGNPPIEVPGNPQAELAEDPPQVGAPAEAPVAELEDPAAAANNDQAAGDVEANRAQPVMDKDRHFKLEMASADNKNKFARAMGLYLDGLGKIISANASTDAEKARAAADRVDGTGRMLQDLANQFGQTISAALSAYQNATETFKRSAGG